jgi:hypothetical protein
MELYEKIKKFVAIKPVAMNIGTYLKDASQVCKIYYEMNMLERLENREEAVKKEKELEKEMAKILEKWGE